MSTTDNMPDHIRMETNLKGVIEDRGFSEYEDEIMTYSEELSEAASTGKFQNVDAALASAYRAATGERFADVAEEFGIDGVQNPGDSVRNVYSTLGLEEQFDEPQHLLDSRKSGQKESNKKLSRFESTEGIFLDISENYPEGVGQNKREKYANVADRLLNEARNESAVIDEMTVVEMASEEYSQKTGRALNESAKMAGEVTSGADNIVKLDTKSYAVLPAQVNLGGDEFSVYHSRESEGDSIGDLSHALHSELEETMNRESVAMIYNEMQRRAGVHGSVEAEELEDAVQESEEFLNLTEN